MSQALTRPYPSPLPSTSQSSSSFRMPCVDFAQTGFCKYGDECLFNHDPALVIGSGTSTGLPTYRMSISDYSSVTSSTQTSPSVRSASLRDADDQAMAYPEAALPPRPRNTNHAPTLHKQQRKRGSKRSYQPRPQHLPQYPPYYGAAYHVPIFSPPPVPTMPYWYDAYAYPPGAFHHPYAIPHSHDLEHAILKTPPSHTVPPAPQQAMLSPLTTVSRSTSVSVPESEVYDFDDEPEEAVVVEKPQAITTYEHAKVGVLGGGVKLGSSKAPSSPRKMKLTDVITRDDAELFDSDGEYDNEPQLPPVDPASIPLPESLDEDLIEPVESASRTSTPPPPVLDTTPTRLRTFSWADDEDDGAYFSGPLPSFGELYPVEEPVSTPLEEHKVVDERPPVKTPAKEVKAGFSYAAIAGAGVKSHGKVIVASSAPPAIPESPFPTLAEAVVHPRRAPTQARGNSPARSIASSTGSQHTTTSKTFDTSAISAASLPSGDRSPKKSSNRRRQKSKSPADILREAQQIYGKLGFVLSPQAAREVELLRLLEQKKMQEAAKSAKETV